MRLVLLCVGKFNKGYLRHVLCLASSSKIAAVSYCKLPTYLQTTSVQQNITRNFKPLRSGMQLPGVFISYDIKFFVEHIFEFQIMICMFVEMLYKQDSQLYDGETGWHLLIASLIF